MAIFNWMVSRNISSTGFANRFNVIQVAKKFGYDASREFVKTKDNYIISMHRIAPHFSSVRNQKYPVLLLSGLLCDANFFFVPNSDKNLPFLLSSKGYDVWLGNVRGTYYSQTSLEEEDYTGSRNFWNFTVDEMAKYDIPAMIDFVLAKTNSEKIHYIGHSQGSMILFGAISLDPELNNKINDFIALGPAARIANIRGVLSHVTYMKSYIKACDEDIGSCHLVLSNLKELYFLINACQYIPYLMCKWSLMSLTGWNPDDINKEILMSLIYNVPSATSAKNIVQYIQFIESKKFSMFDYGSLENLKIYGEIYPPEYNISRTIIPVHIFSGGNDYLTPPEDVQWIFKQLKNGYLLEYENPGHLDYVIGSHSSPIIFNKIMSILADSSERDD